MNKNQLKRYKRIGEEIAQFHQDLEDAQKWLNDCYVRRDYDGARDTLKTIENIYQEIGIREVIREEILLPQYVKLEDAMNTIHENIKDDCKLDGDGEWILTNYGEDFLEEFVAMYLVDNYNHCLFTFDWVVKGSTIFVSNIRWNQHQLLKCDLKELLKGMISRIDIGDISLIKNTHFKNTIVLYDRREPNYEKFSLNEAIKWLEEHYYL